MKTIIPYIRLASYAICLAVAFLMLARVRHVIPVRLEDSDAAEFRAKQEAILRDQQRAAKISAAVVTSKDFRNTRMSGRQVVATALAAATKNGSTMTEYGEPHITLANQNGKLVWYVGYYDNSPIPSPGGFFTIEIDDETGQTILHPGE